MRLRRLGLSPRARPPWVPPAATGETCWNLTSLTDFCNQHEDRTHPANDRPSREAAFPALHPCRCNVSLFWGSPSRGNTAPTVSGAFPEPKLRPDAKDAGCAGRTRSSQRARGGAEANSNSFERLLCHRLDLPRAGTPRGPRRSRPSSNLPRERYRPSEEPEAPSTVKKPVQGANPAWPPSFRRPRATSGVDTPLTRP